jgi:molybdopterin/thiamine biosynthesis adenylyltransferase
VVPSAHRISQAQTVRGETYRFLTTPEERAALRALSAGEAVELVLSEHDYNKHWLIQPTRLGPKDDPLWVRPSRVVDARTRHGFAIRLPSSVEMLAEVDIEKLRTFLASIDLGHVIEQMDGDAGEFYMLLVGESAFKLLCTWPGKDKRAVISYTLVELPEPQVRLSESYAALADKSVAIVGGGSIGSKVAASLARSGVGKFVLVDEDILNPDNLVRNDLDARAVGMHKVDGIAARAIEVNSNARISKRRIKLGGQESAASTDSAMKEIASCDLIIDATADPFAFNLCASVARSERKPMVWGEVFAGGIGGLIARVRPDLEPPPHSARRQILAWCERQGVPWEGRTPGNYELSQTTTPPLVADDADVTVIAGHMAQLALDTLLRGAESAFPKSAYAIGFAKAWIFLAPFDTAPIAFSPEGAWGPDADPDAAEHLKALVAELFPDTAQETDAT